MRQKLFYAARRVVLCSIMNLQDFKKIAGSENILILEYNLKMYSGQSVLYIAKQVYRHNNFAA